LKDQECGENAIAKAYRKKALKYHPDKLKKELTDKDKQLWNKVKKAYDTLMDPAKRKTYDSSLPFDDKFPKMCDIKNDKEFYEKYHEVF